MSTLGGYRGAWGGYVTSLRVKGSCEQCGFQSWFEDGQAIMWQKQGPI